MPLPLLFIGIAAATGLLGVGKGVKAVVDTNKAKELNQNANDILKKAKRDLDKARKISKKSIEKLGKYKLDILNGCISDFVNTVSKLKNVDFQKSVGINELNKFKIDEQELMELSKMSKYATSVLSGITSGAGALGGGALIAFGAYSAAGTFATASTGTAISTLGGIAAKNATLAFFGGGSLAAGGLGIAGGTIVLGGLVTGPALAIMGFIVGAKANTEKNKAYENLATAKRTATEMDITSDMCYAIAKRSDMFLKLLRLLKAYMTDLNIKMKEAIDNYGANYQFFPDSEKKNVFASYAVAKAIKTILYTSILSEDGTLTSESEKIIRITKKYLKEHLK